MESQFLHTYICICNSDPLQDWRLYELGKRAKQVNHLAIQMLTKVESALWLPRGYKCWNPCDALLVAVWLFEEKFVLQESTWHATVDLTGTHTRGQMVLDHLKQLDENVRIIELVDVEVFKQIAEWVAGLRDDPLWRVSSE